MTRVNTGGLEIREVDPVDVSLVDSNVELMPNTPHSNTGCAAGQRTLFLCDRFESSSFQCADNTSPGSDDYSSVLQHGNTVNSKGVFIFSWTRVLE